MSSIILLPRPGVSAAPDVRPLVYALSRMAPGSWAPILLGESFEDSLTRREAARDILDELLTEFADGALEKIRTLVVTSGSCLPCRGTGAIWNPPKGRMTCPVCFGSGQK